MGSKARHTEPFETVVLRVEEGLQLLPTPPPQQARGNCGHRQQTHTEDTNSPPPVRVRTQSNDSIKRSLRIILRIVTRPSTAFLDRLSDALQRREPEALVEEGARHAAVAVVVTREQDAALLFVKRRERAGDPWSGHIAFPGGHAEVGESPATTAERETLEETGLALGSVGRRLGQLDDVYPRSVYLPKIIVTPVVFEVPSRLEVRPSREIERAVWVQAGAVFDPVNRKPFVVSMLAGKREFESIHVAGLVIWGLTERILSQIATAIEQML